MTADSKLVYWTGLFTRRLRRVGLLTCEPRERRFRQKLRVLQTRAAGFEYFSQEFIKQRQARHGITPVKLLAKVSKKEAYVKKETMMRKSLPIHHDGAHVEKCLEEIYACWVFGPGQISKSSEAWSIEYYYHVLFHYARNQ